MREAVANAVDDRATRVLVVEDDPDVARLVAMILAEDGHEVDVAGDATDALMRATKVRPELVVLDVGLPGMSGLDVAKALRADVATATVVVVFLTARPDERLVAFTSGADDFLTKPFDPEELRVRARAALRRAEGRQSVSPLTGLPGNIEVLRQLEQAVAEPDEHFALIWADLDNFKAFNDRYGFLRGDHAIGETARLLLSQVESVSGQPRFLGHIGGDDFALVVSDDVAENLAASIVAAFDALAPSLYDLEDRRRGFIEVSPRRGEPQRIPLLTISLGIATTARRRFSLPQEVVAVANEAKQWAKNQDGSAWWADHRRPAAPDEQHRAGRSS
jgi:diguanylate cyclase (GGDEF)-like protein